MANLFETEHQPLTENSSNLTAVWAADQRQKALTFAFMAGYWKALGRQGLSDRYAKRAVYELDKIPATLSQFSTPFQFTSWYMGKGH